MERKIMTVDGVPLQQFVIVADRILGWNLKEKAEKLAQSLETVSGVRPEIVDDEAQVKEHEIHNGKGLVFTVNSDRNGDIVRLHYKENNLGYMSPCGYVAPAYYDKEGTNGLRSFTAGFLTTCGLENVGVANEDEGETLPFHGSIANIPCERAYWTEEEKSITVHTMARDEVIFGRKWKLFRELVISTEENTFEIRDTVVNTSDQVQPMELLYHFNMGYPLLDEDSIVEIPSQTVTPRDAHAAEDAENWMRMQKPTAGYQERCYFHKFADEKGRASIYQPKLNFGVEFSFDATMLDGFTEWKMMGVRDYALGLECANCYPNGRKEMREQAMLKFMQPGEEKTYCVKVKIVEK